MSKHMSKNMYKHTSQHKSKHMSEHVSKHTSEHVSKCMSKNMPEHTELVMQPVDTRPKELIWLMWFFFKKKLIDGYVSLVFGRRTPSGSCACEPVERANTAARGAPATKKKSSETTTVHSF